MSRLFYGQPHLEDLKGLAKRIAVRLAAGEIKEPITSSGMRRHFASEYTEYQDALRELELRNCVRLEKQRNKRGRPSIYVKVHPKLHECHAELSGS